MSLTVKCSPIIRHYSFLAKSSVGWWRKAIQFFRPILLIRLINRINLIYPPPFKAKGPPFLQAALLQYFREGGTQTNFE
ncbi:MAG TPA: hypothetical protein ENL01_02240 [Chlorobaculum parvum]|uniref:Uncharacterized protein n=1 Tax=Chlorobaculum parvum TaxID=274539 RepID=A0A7C5DEB4_9CHLB|nr:hypothetical protein [Chlorobaculum parvum]